MDTSQKGWLGYAGAFTLIALVLFLAVDISYRLYQPPKFNARLPYSTLTIFSGTARVQSLEGISWKEAWSGMTLEPGSRIQTAADSYALLTFFEGTTTRLEPETDLTLARLAGGTIEKPQFIVLKQWAGKTWNEVSRLPDDSYHFSIQTPSAEATVRGTLFLTEVDKSGKTTLKTSEGRVDVSARGQKVDVTAGNQTEVARGQPPLPPVPIPPAGNELVVSISGPVVARVIDPTGLSTGFLPDGSEINQITGAVSSLLPDYTHMVRIPEPKAGDYTTTVRAFDSGISRVDVEVIAGGKSAYKNSSSAKVTAGSERALNLQMDVVSGLMKGARLTDAKPRPTATPRPANTTKAPASVDEKPIDSNAWRIVMGVFFFIVAAVMVAKLVLSQRRNV